MAPSEISLFTDDFPGFNDLLGTLFGMPQHRLRQAIRLEFVRMVSRELSSVGLGDLGIGRLDADPEHLVGFLQAHARDRCRAGAPLLLLMRLLLPGALARRTLARTIPVGGLSAVTAGAMPNAQHSLKARKFETRHTHHRRHSQQQRTHGPAQIRTANGRTHLDLKKGTQ